MIIVTHNGKFHADDVFAVATLLLFLKGKKVDVVRTRDEDKIKEADFVVDVGGIYDPEKGRYDHHQIGGAGARTNGIPYASFGLVWKEFGEKVSGSSFVFQNIDRTLVQTIDCIDSGIEPYTVAFKDMMVYDVGDVIDGFVSEKRGQKKQMDNNFTAAIILAKGIIMREIERFTHVEVGYVKAEQAYKNSQNKQIIVLESLHSWKDVFIQKREPLFVVFPHESGDRWAVKGVPVKQHSFERRMWLPESWRGKQSKELQEVTGVSDALFVHKDGFIGAAESKEGAFELAKKAIEINNS